MTRPRWLKRMPRRAKLAYLLILASLLAVLRNIHIFHDMDEQVLSEQQQKPQVDHVSYKMKSEGQRHVSSINVPQWDPRRPLPEWFVETQKFIRRMETENRPYSFFERYRVYDVNIWLGLNNIRYELEMSNNYGVILNRTVIIPSRIYAWSCAQYELCQISGGRLTDLAEIIDTVFNRWSLDIKSVWDVEGMRKTLNVMTAEEFNRIMLVQQGIVIEDPEAWIASLGGDLRFPRAFGVLKIYHDLDRRISVDSQPTMEFLYGHEDDVEILDDMDPLPNKKRCEMSVNETEERTVPIRWRDTREDNSTGDNGTMPLGFKQHFASNATILHLQEGVHMFGQFPFQFTTPAAREHYLNVILNEIPLNKELREAQEYVLAKFQAMIGNKPYLGFHYRVGDFVRYAWTKAEPSEAMVHRFVYCNWLLRDQSNTTSDCEIDLSTLHWTIPPATLQEEEADKATWKHMERCINRPFYFATDETNPGFIAGLKRIGGFGIDDILDDGFLKKYLHLAAFGDYHGMLDQWVLANSEQFIGAAMSSLTGGVLNLRRKIDKPGPTGPLINEILRG